MMDWQLIIIFGIVPIITSGISAWTAVASHRAEKAANHGNEKIAELKGEILELRKCVRPRPTKVNKK